MVDVLLDYIREQNDRSSKILHFHHPEEMKKLIDLSIPDQPVPLDSLIKVRLGGCPARTGPAFSPVATCCTWA